MNDSTGYGRYGMMNFNNSEREFNSVTGSISIFYIYPIMIAFFFQ